MTTRLQHAVVQSVKQTNKRLYILTFSNCYRMLYIWIQYLKLGGGGVIYILKLTLAFIFSNCNIHIWHDISIKNSTILIFLNKFSYTYQRLDFNDIYVNYTLKTIHYAYLKMVQFKSFYFQKEKWNSANEIEFFHWN